MQVIQNQILMQIIATQIQILMQIIQNQILMLIEPRLFDKRPLIFASAFAEKGHEIYKFHHSKALPASLNRKQIEAMM